MAADPVRIRVLVAHDHPLTRAGLKVMIEGDREMKVVAEAPDAASAIERCREHRPDVVILDVRMPVPTGGEATAAFLAAFPEARVLVLSAADGDEALDRALRTGARGCLRKNVDRPELVDAIRAVHGGARRLSSPATGHPAGHVVRSDLTPREMQVLRLMTEGRGNRAIAEALSLTERSVKAYVSTILGKLGVANRTQALTAAVRRGLVHID